MEVGNAFFGYIWNAYGLQVGSDRLGGVVIERKHGLSTRLVPNPVAEFMGKGLGDWLIRRLPVLRAAGFHSNDGLGTIQAERLRSQAPQLIHAKTSPGGRSIRHRS